MAMEPVDWIGIWAALFLVTHLGMTTESIRPRLVNALGEQPYLGVYSAISFATFIPLVVEFARHKHAGATLWYLRDVGPVRLLAIVMMMAALLIIVVGFANPSPATVGAATPGQG